MTVTCTAACEQPEGAGKGVCLRMAVKWAATAAVGGTPTMLLTHEEWLVQKKSRLNTDSPSKSYSKFHTDLESGPLSFLDLAEAEKSGLGKRARWGSTIAKQNDYVAASAEAEGIRANVLAVDRDFVVKWSDRIARRHGATIAVETVDISHLGSSVAVFVTNRVDAAKQAFVLCRDHAGPDGGHSVAFANGVMFDPNGGEHVSDEADLAKQFADLEAHLQKRYGKHGTVAGATVHLLRRGS